jgi:hypothetical protein
MTLAIVAMACVGFVALGWRLSRKLGGTWVDACLFSGALVGGMTLGLISASMATVVVLFTSGLCPALTSPGSLSCGILVGDMAVAILVGGLFLWPIAILPSLGLAAMGVMRARVLRGRGASARASNATPLTDRGKEERVEGLSFKMQIASWRQ